MCYFLNGWAGCRTWSSGSMRAPAPALSVPPHSGEQEGPASLPVSQRGSSAGLAKTISMTQRWFTSICLYLGCIWDATKMYPTSEQYTSGTFMKLMNSKLKGISHGPAFITSECSLSCGVERDFSFYHTVAPAINIQTIERESWVHVNITAIF